MAKFGLELAGEKTRILEFGRFTAENRKKRGERKPETFSFLGFTFFCSLDGRKQFFRVKVKTDRKKLISKLKKLEMPVRLKANGNLQFLAHLHKNIFPRRKC